MNEIMMFEGKEVEIIELEGKILFNAKNVAATKFTRWTPKGRVFLYEELKRHDIEPMYEY